MAMEGWQFVTEVLVVDAVKTWLATGTAQHIMDPASEDRFLEVHCVRLNGPEIYVGLYPADTYGGPLQVADDPIQIFVFDEVTGTLVDQDFNPL